MSGQYHTETIVENIKSLISLKYPKFEVIVINDGSKDETLNRVIQEFDLKRGKPTCKVQN